MLQRTAVHSTNSPKYFQANMPASHKMLKNKQHAANRAAGIGDEQGRMAARVKPAEVLGRCTICSQEIRMTKKNIEAKAHFDSRHPTSTFAACFPGHSDPTVEAPVAAAAASGGGGGGSVPKKKVVEDLSFLDAALDKPKKK